MTFRIARSTPLLLLALFTACEGDARGPLPEVVRTLPHDRGAYTQGLLLHDGRFYESTGQYGNSSLREVDPETGAVLRIVRLDESFFGEGLARVENRLIQLTWHENVAFIYDIDTFQRVGTFEYEGEGWGLCYDGQSLYMTDGGSSLLRRDPATFELLGRLPVTLRGAPLSQVNELECVGDDIYANVYMSNLIVRISKTTGEVLDVHDLGDITRESRPAATEAVLNGIAYDERTGSFYVTGKLWPTMYEVRLPRTE